MQQNYSYSEIFYTKYVHPVQLDTTKLEAQQIEAQRKCK